MSSLSNAALDERIMFESNRDIDLVRCCIRIQGAPKILSKTQNDAETKILLQY